jgi:hypothetical protein
MAWKMCENEAGAIKRALEHGKAEMMTVDMERENEDVEERYGQGELNNSEMSL